MIRLAGVRGGGLEGLLQVLPELLRLRHGERAGEMVADEGLGGLQHLVCVLRGLRSVFFGLLGPVLEQRGLVRVEGGPLVRWGAQEHPVVVGEVVHHPNQFFHHTTVGLAR